MTRSSGDFGARPAAAATSDGYDPRFVDGIGPPLSQIKQDYQELLDEADNGSVYAGKHRQCARDVLALITEVWRLRGTV